MSAGAGAFAGYLYAKSKASDEQIALHQELALQLDEATFLQEQLATCQQHGLLT